MSRPLRNPAVVVNAETAGIGIIHALQLGGVDMITVDRRWPPTYGRFSQFAKQRVTFDPRRGETLTDALLRLAQRFEGRGILFPSTDADLEDLILNYDRLSARYHVPAAPQIGTQIFAKNWQYELAERSGVAIPRCVRFAAGTTPDVDGFRFPLIIKPSSRAETAGDQVFRLRILATPEQLRATLAEIAAEFAGREFQVAENIPGEPDQLYTIGSYSGRDGKVMRSYSGRKRTQYPYYHGMASVSETMTLPPRVFDAARRLLDAAGFQGISQVEFKYDARDDEYKLLEINGRSWLWVKLSAFSGVNLPLIQYYDLTGDPRLPELLESPQNDARFFVFEHHVKLNQRADERRLIDTLLVNKEKVSAIRQPGDWSLALVHDTLSFFRRLRHKPPPAAALLPEVMRQSTMTTASEGPTT